ncbi:hypothetical protein JCM10207_002005 [Rhodosporidiobolus poonsookiae]
MSQPRPDRPRKNTSLACGRCRSRKVKCGGEQPACKACVAKGADCDYTQSVDGRRANRPHAKLALLEQENAKLRALLDQHGIVTPSTSAPQPMEEVTKRSDPDEGIPTAADGLQFDAETGNLVFLGPTSIPPRQGVSPTSPEDSAWFPPPSFRPEASSSASPTQLDTGKDHDTLLALYFQHLNGFAAFIDEPSFRAGLAASSPPSSTPSTSTSASSSTAVAPPPVYSPFLHLTLLALASHISDLPSQSSISPAARGLSYLRHAATYLPTELERPTPSTVVGLTIFKACLSDYGKVSLAWVYSGIAIRLAQGLGLNVDARPLVKRRVLSAEQLAEREDAFWSIYLQDKLVSLYVGRSPALCPYEHNVPPPPFDVDPIKAALSKLGDYISTVMDMHYTVKRDRRVDRGAFEKLQRELVKWHEDLPPSVQIPPEPAVPPQNVFMIHLLYNVTTIFLNRPFLTQRALPQMPVENERCIATALSSHALAKRFDATHGMRNAFITATQCLYVPACLLTHLLASPTPFPSSSPRALARTALEDLAANLATLAQSWGTAAQGVAAIEGLRKRVGPEAGMDAPGGEEAKGEALPFSSSLAERALATAEPTAETDLTAAANTADLDIHTGWDALLLPESLSGVLEWPSLSTTFGWTAEDPFAVDTLQVW